MLVVLSLPFTALTPRSCLWLSVIALFAAIIWVSCQFILAVFLSCLVPTLSYLQFLFALFVPFSFLFFLLFFLCHLKDTRELISKLKGHTSPITAITFSFDGRYVDNVFLKILFCLFFFLFVSVAFFQEFQCCKQNFTSL